LPPEGEAFAIHIDGGPAPYTESDRYQMLRIGIQGYAVPPEERKDVSLTFVIDVSGSMDMENRLELVKDALELLVEQLPTSDSVGIVVYGDTTHVVLESTIGADKETIIRQSMPCSRKAQPTPRPASSWVTSLPSRPSSQLGSTV
jgi:Ca-activated chloride channel family protein